MKVFLSIAVALTSFSALADGFRCFSKKHSLKAEVYHNVDATLGTRTAYVMILSDQKVNTPRKTIITFLSSPNSRTTTLSNTGATYTGRVDLRLKAHRKGELLAGTKVGAVKEMILKVDHKFNKPVANNAAMDGVLVLKKRNRNAKDISVKMSCTRYLKN